MTQPRELDHILTAFFVAGTDELADRVIDAALIQIDHTPQRHALRMPWRFPAMTMTTRLAAAAVIGVLAVGGALYLMKPPESSIGSPTPTPAGTAIPGRPTAAPTATPYVAPALTGPLGAGRQIHTATVLADGRVLVAGGLDFADLPIASATLYDPGTGRFTATGSMGAARAAPTATRLADGRVLVAGGGPAGFSPHPGPLLASAELFDPGAGAFSPTGSMATPRQGHTATLLRDGRVLITGGIDTEAADHPVASAELFDPRAGTFSPTGSMANARSFHTATLLADGRVLITGGSSGGWSWNRPMPLDAEIYDPTSGTFSTTGTIYGGRAWHTATLLADGRVLVTAGVANDGSQPTASELFDPGTGKFSATGSMSTPRYQATATLLTDGRVLVVGGGADYENRRFLASAEIYDPTTGTFSATGPMTDARTYHTASLLTDGRVLVAGGYGSIAPLANAEIWDPATGAFTPAS